MMRQDDQGVGEGNFRAWFESFKRGLPHDDSVPN